MTGTDALTDQPVEFRRFWESLGRGRISFPYCDECARFHWYPMKQCPGCGNASLRWRSVAGPCTLFTWTVVRRAFAEEYVSDVPYVIGLVAFDDAPGVRLVTRLEETHPDRLAIGMPLRPVIITESDELPRVTFRPR